MPQHSLSKMTYEIANVLTYIRQNFGAKAGGETPEKAQGSDQMKHTKSKYIII
jgi:hypothetical protein